MLAALPVTVARTSSAASTQGDEAAPGKHLSGPTRSHCCGVDCFVGRTSMRLVSLCPVMILSLASLLGCATTQDCWDHPASMENINSDDAFCTSQGDAAGGYLTGGLAGAIAERRKYDACMASKGYYVRKCSP